MQQAMAQEKNKVIVWRPFPSPTKREGSVMPAMINPLKSMSQESQSERDQAAVNRWIELADMLNGNPKPKNKRKGAA